MGLRDEVGLGLDGGGGWWWDPSQSSSYMGKESFLRPKTSFITHIIANCIR